MNWPTSPGRSHLCFRKSLCRQANRLYWPGSYQAMVTSLQLTNTKSTEFVDGRIGRALSYRNAKFGAASVAGGSFSVNFSHGTFSGASRAQNRKGDTNTTVADTVGGVFDLYGTYEGGFVASKKQSLGMAYKVQLSGAKERWTLFRHPARSHAVAAALAVALICADKRTGIHAQAADSPSTEAASFSIVGRVMVEAERLVVAESRSPPSG